jgi:hypothetical protein
LSDMLKDLSQKELRLYEKLLMVFPGYRGYKEKELIRRLTGSLEIGCSGC